MKIIIDKITYRGIYFDVFECDMPDEIYEVVTDEKEIIEYVKERLDEYINKREAE